MKFEATAEGSVRTCQPYDPDTCCPSCDTNRGPVRLGRLRFGSRPHKTGLSDGHLMTRICRNCATTWREKEH